jgi:hypothetical protein
MLALIGNFFELIGGALTLNGEVLLAARDAPRAYLAAVIMALAAGISLSLGQCVVLFANRVPPGRFTATVLAGALLYGARLLLWTVAIWVVGVISPRYALPLDTIFLAVCFGQAPQLFGFFIMIPYLGMSLRRVLDAYSLIVVVAGLRVMLDVPVLAAFFAAGLGWLLQSFVAGLLERPLAGVRAWMWRTASGREDFASAGAIVDELLGSPRAPQGRQGTQTAPAGPDGPGAPGGASGTGGAGTGAGPAAGGTGR